MKTTTATLQNKTNADRAIDMNATNMNKSEILKYKKKCVYTQQREGKKSIGFHVVAVFKT